MCSSLSQSFCSGEAACSYRLRRASRCTPARHTLTLYAERTRYWVPLGAVCYINCSLCREFGSVFVDACFQSANHRFSTLARYLLSICKGFLVTKKCEQGKMAKASRGSPRRNDRRELEIYVSSRQPAPSHRDPHYHLRVCRPWWRGVRPHVGPAPSDVCFHAARLRPVPSLASIADAAHELSLLVRGNNLLRILPENKNFFSRQRAKRHFRREQATSRSRHRRKRSRGLLISTAYVAAVPAVLA